MPESPQLRWDTTARLGFELGDTFAARSTETTQSLVCVLDATGTVLLFNDACERATGLLGATRWSAATRASR